MNTQLEASVTLINDKIKFTGTAQDNPPISIDYIPPFGDGEGYMPLQLLLLSLASCSGQTIILVFKKYGKTVTEFKVKAEGTRRDKHPTSFSNIRLTFDLTSPDATEDDLIAVIKSSEEKLCPVWDMLKEKVDISYEYKISKA